MMNKTLINTAFFRHRRSPFGGAAQIYTVILFFTFAFVIPAKAGIQFFLSLCPLCPLWLKISVAKLC